MQWKKCETLKKEKLVLVANVNGKKRTTNKTMISYKKRIFLAENEEILFYSLVCICVLYS